MRRLITLGITAALLVALDVGARAYVETTVNTRARQQAPEGSRVSASIGGFPFLPRLVLGGQVSHADVHIENIKADALTFAEVEIDLRGVELDRSRLFNDRKARINGISHGTVTAVVTQEALSDVLHQNVVMADGQISVTVAGRSIPLTPVVAASGRLTLNGQGLTKPFSLVIPSTAFVPCVGDVTVLAGRMKLSCAITKVPPALLDVVQDQPV